MLIDRDMQAKGSKLEDRGRSLDPRLLCILGENVLASQGISDLIPKMKGIIQWKIKRT